MKNNIRLHYLVAILMGLFFCVLPANAAIFSTYSLVGASGLYGEAAQQLNLPGYHFESSGSAMDTTELMASHDSGHGIVFAKSRAASSLTASRFLRTSAFGSGTGTGLFSSAGDAEGLAVWRDVAFVDSPVPAATIRLNFFVDGQMTVNSFGPEAEGGFRGNYAQVNLGWVSGLEDAEEFLEVTANYFASPSGGSSRFVQAQAGLYQSFSDETKQFSSDGAWDSVGLVDGAFAGTFHIDVPYTESIQGYAWGLGMSSFASGLGGAGESDFLNTLKFEAATLLDGTPITVQFESGLTFESQLNAIPEPSTLMLAVAGLLVVTNYRRRRTRLACDMID